VSARREALPIAARSALLRRNAPPPLMSWFQLDASSIAGRVHAEGEGDRTPTLLGSLMRGVIGFTIVSVAGFLPWAMFGGWLVRRFGEGGMFGACAAIFVVLSGVLLHRLIIGPDSLLIFYKLFSLAFAAFALAWIVGWTCLGGDLGSAAGLLGGAIGVAWILSRAFEARGAFWKVAPLLFVLTALGYFGGGRVEMFLRVQGGFGLPPGLRETIARLLWGVCFGAGCGAGLGLGFYLCQAEVREFLRAESGRHAKPAES
jgi:hypothetical protein